jgi:hypothetical protein
MMATANTQPEPRSRRRGRWRRIALVLVLLLAGAGAWYGPDLHDQAVAGTAYGARVACSCRYVGGRGLEDCRKDFEPGMAMVSLSEDAEAKSVTASVPLLSSQTARFREGYGCVLEKWER